MLEGWTLVVHSVYALYTGEPTLWDLVTENTGPVFPQPAQPTPSVPAPEPAPVTETFSVWTRFKNWWMGPNKVKKQKQKQELNDALQCSIDDFFKNEKENVINVDVNQFVKLFENVLKNEKEDVNAFAKVLLLENPHIKANENANTRANVKNYVDWFVSTMLIANPEMQGFAYAYAVLLVNANTHKNSVPQIRWAELEAKLLQMEQEWNSIQLENKNAMKTKIKSV
jgi:hypothetical protein